MSSITNKQLIARWQSARGKHWVDLYYDSVGYTYSGDGCGGNLNFDNSTDAVIYMEKFVQNGYDGINMRRVY